MRCWFGEGQLLPTCANLDKTSIFVAAVCGSLTPSKARTSE
jgi:hypothetical protein